MLVLSRRIGDRINIGDNVVVTITDIRGDKVKVGIDAPRSVSVHRPDAKSGPKQETTDVGTD